MQSPRVARVATRRGVEQHTHLDVPAGGPEGPAPFRGERAVQPTRLVNGTGGVYNGGGGHDVLGSECVYVDPSPLETNSVEAIYDNLCDD